MNRTDDGFDQEPPIVEDFDPADYAPLGASSGNVQYLGFGAAGLLFIAIGYFAYRQITKGGGSRRQERAVKQQTRNRKQKKN
jgi:hypothetical protein